MKRTFFPHSINYLQQTLHIFHTKHKSTISLWTPLQSTIANDQNQTHQNSNNQNWATNPQPPIVRTSNDTQRKAHRRPFASRKGENPRWMSSSGSCTASAWIRHWWCRQTRNDVTRSSTCVTEPNSGTLRAFVSRLGVGFPFCLVEPSILSSIGCTCRKVPSFH